MFKTIRKFKIFFHREIILEKDIINFKTSAPYQDLLITQAKRSELLQLIDIWSLNLKDLERRLDSNNSLCYISYFKGDIASYHWVQVSGTHFIRPIGKYIEIKETQFVIYHTRVKDEFQNKGINKAVIYKIIADQAKLGFSKVLIYTSSKNTAQLKSLFKMGFTQAESIRSLFFANSYFSMSKVWD